MIKVSERIKELRLEKGLNLAQLGKSIGVDETTVGRWEKGFRLPSIENLYAMAIFFGVSADYLLGLED